MKVRLTVAPPLLLAALVCLSSSAAAGPLSGFPRIPAAPPSAPFGDTASANADGSPSSDISSDGLVRAYMAAQRDLTEARILLAKAFDLKELVLELELERQALGSSSTLTRGELKRQQKVSAQADEAIGKRIEEEQRLTEEGKQHYRASLEPYGRGLIKAGKLPMAAKRFLQQAKSKATSKSLQDKMSLGASGKAAVFVAKGIPPFVKLARKTFKQVRSYSKKLKIEIPADATAVLASLDDGEGWAEGEADDTVEFAEAVAPAPAFPSSQPAEPAAAADGWETSSMSPADTGAAAEPGWGRTATPARDAAPRSGRPAMTAPRQSVAVATESAGEPLSKDRAQPRAFAAGRAPAQAAPTGEARAVVAIPGTAHWEPWTERYHLDGNCPLIFKKSLRKMSVNDAIDRELTPCRQCARPVHDPQGP